MGFFSNLTGGDTRKDISKAYKKASGEIAKGYEGLQSGYGEAIGTIDPYAQQGGAANAFYYDLLGLNGPEARAAAQQTIASDPAYQGQLAQDSNALLRALNARGQSAGGLSALTGARVGQEGYQNWINRYRDAGQQGFQAAGAKAGLQQGLGDAAYGYGGTLANMAIGKGQAMGATRNTGMNNLLGVLGTGLNAYSTFMGGGKK